MASTASGRGRPAIIDKADLSLGNGSNATIRLVGEGDTVQIELPLSWSLDSLQRSATRTGGRTKVTFTFDAEPDAGHTNGSSAPSPAPAPVSAPEAKRTRATKKVAAPAEPAAPAATEAPAKKTSARRPARKKAEVAV